MNSPITKEFLDSIGVELDETAYESLVNHFGETLEQRIVNEVVNSLLPEQLEEIEAQAGASGEELQAWLRANVPELNEIIKDEVDIMLGELAEHADNIDSVA